MRDYKCNEQKETQPHERVPVGDAMMNLVQGRAEIDAHDDCRTDYAGQNSRPAAKEPGKKCYWNEKEYGKLDYFAGCEIVADSDQHQGHCAEEDQDRLMLLAQKGDDVHVRPLSSPGMRTLVAARHSFFLSVPDALMLGLVQDFITLKSDRQAELSFL